MPDTVSVLGGSGFAGRFLLDRWPVGERGQLRFLLHRSRPDWLDKANVDVRPIDLSDIGSLRTAFDGTQCVINLLRPDGSGWLRTAMEQLLPVFEQCAIRHLVHASSIDVYGGTNVSHVTEDIEPEPQTPYEREHRAMEELVHRAPFSTCIVRPGAIFGLGGRNLVGFVPEMQSAPVWRLAARRSLYGRRRMHLVSVENVADAIRAVATSTQPEKNIILVTDDHASENNFAFVQEAMLQAFERLALNWVPELPKYALRVLLRARGRTNADPERRFSNDRLAATGFRPKQDFHTRLNRYVSVLRDTAKFRLS